MTSTGVAKLNEAFGLGRYTVENNLVNGRVAYHNIEAGTYLYWLSAGNWLV